MDYTVKSDGDDNAEVFFGADNPDLAHIKVAVPDIKHDPLKQVTQPHRRIAIQAARDFAQKFLDFSASH